MKRFPGKLDIFITYILKYITFCRVIHKILHTIYYNVWQIYCILLQFLFVCFVFGQHKTKQTVALWPGGGGTNF